MTSGRALVTGSARGLGFAIARELGRRGHRLLLVDVNPDVEPVARSLSGELDGALVDHCVADLATAEGLTKVVEATRTHLGQLDALVNNAGITRDARLGSMSAEDFSHVVEVNLVAPARLTLGLEDVLADGASVINVSSRAALGNFGQVNYVASKAGLIGFTRGLALAWAPRVRVNAVAPGLIDSEMSRSMPTDVLNRLVERIPAQRIGTPADIARAVAFLASNDSTYITGQVLTICGGRSIAP